MVVTVKHSFEPLHPRYLKEIRWLAALEIDLCFCGMDNKNASTASNFME